MNTAVKPHCSNQPRAVSRLCGPAHPLYPGHQGLQRPGTEEIAQHAPQYRHECGEQSQTPPQLGLAPGTWARASRRAGSERMTTRQNSTPPRYQGARGWRLQAMTRSYSGSNSFKANPWVNEEAHACEAKSRGRSAKLANERDYPCQSLPAL